MKPGVQSRGVTELWVKHGGEQMYFYRARVILWSHIVPACDCQPSANSTLLVVASTVENFVLIHFMGKDRNLGARWLQ